MARIALSRREGQLLVTYDPSIIQQAAEGLYAQARRILALGAVVGFIGGVVVAVSMGFKLGMGEVIVAGAIGALIGYSLAQSRAFALRLQAQVALCQAQIEVNTRSVAQQTQNTKAA